ncbi:MAG: hypothetical protein AAGK05_07310 [Pseudomonadota bacterium]
MKFSLPSIFLTNARCIRNKIDEIVLKASELSPDILIFCESWLGDAIPDDAIKIPGYTAFRNDRNVHGGGLITYFANKLQVKVIEPQNIPSLASTVSEFSIFVLPDISLLLVVLYHPVWNDSGEHERGLSCLLDIIDFVLTSHLDPCKARIVMCGDFIVQTQITGLKQIVNFPTRGKNTLDQIFTNISSVNSIRIFPPLGKSDHSCIFWSHDNVSLNRNVMKKTVRVMSKSNFCHFCSVILGIDWMKYVSSFSDLNEAFAEFQMALKFLLDFCFPR